MDAPASWLERHDPLLPSAGHALDVACGRGRNALWLATRGLSVEAIDRDADAVAALNTIARDLHLPVAARVVDLESGRPEIRASAYDLIVVTHYLHRPLFPALVEALRPDGLLIYETFTRAQAARGRPSNPSFLLEPGELARLVAPLTILDQREGVFDERDVASVVAKKTTIRP